MTRIVTISVLLFIVSTAFAQMPQTISYQGVLTNQDGTPIPNGNHTLTFKLYTQAAGGSVVWSEIQSMSVLNGMFTAILGKVNSFNLSFDQAHWLGITVGSDMEMVPRIELTAVPYAMHALNVADGQVVRSINSLKDDVTLAAGDNISISQNGKIISITASVSTGPKGEKGDAGEKGEAGEKGDKGDKGSTGATGPQGSAGAKGTTGATGAAGAQGIIGPTGTQGSVGPKGATGPHGPKGEKGATGQHGPRGIPGINGATGPTYTATDPLTISGNSIAINAATNRGDLITWDGVNWVTRQPQPQTPAIQPVNNMQPSLTINYIIALTGVFPSPNGGQSGGDAIIGEIRIFAGNFVPGGWAFCNGQLMSISQNQALFSILGTTYGGDGSTTFSLPDLRGRAPIHAGHGPGLTNRRLGDKGGTETSTVSYQ